MLADFEAYLLNNEEPVRSCLIALDEIVFNLSPRISRAWKYRMPFYTVNGKMFCYLWKDKKTGEPYVGFVEGRSLDFPQLEMGDRARMKILRINSAQEIPRAELTEIVESALALY